MSTLVDLKPKWLFLFEASHFNLYRPSMYAAHSRLSKTVCSTLQR
jgi:hypothetical protein